MPSNITIQNLILLKVNTRKCITARQLLLEVSSHNIFWSKSEIRANLMEILLERKIVEIEILYDTNANESILLPKGTVIRQYER